MTRLALLIAALAAALGFVAGFGLCAWLDDQYDALHPAEHRGGPFHDPSPHIPLTG